LVVEKVKLGSVYFYLLLSVEKYIWRGAYVQVYTEKLTKLTHIVITRKMMYVPGSVTDPVPSLFRSTEGRKNRHQ